MLTGPPTGLPAGWTVEYSTSSNPCTAPVEPRPGRTGGYTLTPLTAADFASVKSIRVSGPSLAENAGVSLDYPVTVPGTTANGQVAVNSFTMYGSDTGSNFGPINTTPASVIASVTSNGTIGDLVFDDTNGDGIHQSGEPGLAGVVVTVKDAGATTVYTTTTTSTGAYEATGLAAGTYTVTFDASAVAKNHKPSPTGPGLDNVGAGPTTVTLSGDGSGGTTSDNLVDFGATPVGQLEINKTVDAATAGHGDTLTYTVTVKNVGIVDASNLAANDELPAGVTFVSATGGGVYSSGQSTVNWTVGSLPVGTTTSFVVVANVASGTNAALLTNSFGVTAPSLFDPTVVDNPCAADATRSCATTAIGAVGALQIDKTRQQVAGGTWRHDYLHGQREEPRQRRRHERAGYRYLAAGPYVPLVDRRRHAVGVNRVVDDRLTCARPVSRLPGRRDGGSFRHQRGEVDQLVRHRESDRLPADLGSQQLRRRRHPRMRVHRRRCRPSGAGRPCGPRRACRPRRLCGPAPAGLHRQRLAVPAADCLAAARRRRRAAFAGSASHGRRTAGRDLRFLASLVRPLDRRSDSS